MIAIGCERQIIRLFQLFGFFSLLPQNGISLAPGAAQPGCRTKEATINQGGQLRSDGSRSGAAQSQSVRRFGRAVIIVAALLLAALAWVGARNAMLVHRGETRARVEAELLAATQGFEEQLRRELLSLDQTLRFLEYEWQGDPDHFDLTARASQAIGRASIARS